MEDLVLGNTYNFETLVGFWSKVSFKNHLVVGIGRYEVVKNLQHLMSELSNIEHTLPESLQRKNWTNEKFYIFRVSTENGVEEVIVPVALVNPDTVTQLNTVTESIEATFPNHDQLVIFHKLLEDYGIEYKIL